MSKRGRDGDLDVEELNVGAWGNVPAGPPVAPIEPVGAPAGGGGRPPRLDDARPWFHRHTNHLIAAAGGFALLVAVIAVASGPSEPEASPSTPPTTAAPPTTARRPVATPAPSTTIAVGRSTGGGNGAPGATDEVDYRFALRTTPDGFEATGAEVIDADDVVDWMMPGGPTLFAADGTSWSTGPWLTVSSGTDRTGLPSMFPFTRPPLAYVIGDIEARTGASVDGIELTALRRGSNVVEIAGLGLDPLATAAVAHALQITDNGIVVPDTAIPPGLRARTDIDVMSWGWGWTPSTRASVSYSSIAGDGWMTFGVRDNGRDSGLLASAPYVLTDLRYLVVRNGGGVGGTYDQPGGDPVHYAIWQVDGREYVASAAGITLDELIGYAAQVVSAGEQEWRDDLWNELRDQARNCCQDREGWTSRFVEVPVAALEDAAWRVEAAVQPASVGWNFSRSDPPGDGFGMSSPLAAPVLRVGSRRGWSDGPAEFPAGAVAIVDRSMVGSLLRLTTTGARPQTVEVRLEPLADEMFTPYLVGSAVLPWSDGGFVAQLIGPDGQTIAVQTDADLL